MSFFVYIGIIIYLIVNEYMAETTNNPIWQGDNFGSPKITTKYLNYTGLADFWSRAKTYIDEQDASRNGQNIPLYPIGTESNKSITTAIEDLSDTINNIPQSDWDEIDETSAAFIKNKTHGPTTIDIRTTGYYTHTNDITRIKHCGNTFELELGVKTRINSSGPPVHVTLTSPNTILIEEAGSSGWVNTYPVSIIDIRKLDVKYLPDDALNANVPQTDWNENNSASSSYVKGRTHYIEYSDDEISSPGRYNLDDYNAIYPVIICFGDSVYEVHEGENRLSYGPPLLVNLEGNTLTIDGSSYFDEYYKIRVAVHIQKLNSAFIPDTTYSAGTGLDLNERTFNLKKASDTELGGIKVGSGLSIDDNGVLSASNTDSARVTIEYSNGTLNMSNVNEMNYNAGTLNLTL